MKVFVVRGEYAEDGTYIVAANDETEVRRAMAHYKSASGSTWDAWQEDFAAEELPGVTAEGEPRVLWS